MGISSVLTYGMYIELLLWVASNVYHDAFYFECLRKTIYAFHKINAILKFTIKRIFISFLQFIVAYIQSKSVLHENVLFFSATWVSQRNVAINFVSHRAFHLSNILLNILIGCEV